MKRLLTVTLVLLLVMSASAFATGTRVLTMGDNNTILEDDANIWLFPGRMFNYPNLAIGEFSGNDFNEFGIHWKFSEDNPWVLGTYFSTLPFVEPEDYFGNDLVIWDFPGSGGTLPSNRRVDLFYGRQLNSTNLGIHVGYINSSRSYDTADKTEEKFSRYLFGFGLTSGSGDWDLAGELVLGSWTDKDSVGTDSTEADGHLDFSIMARYFYQYNPNITFVPHVMLATGKHGAKYARDTSEVKSTRTLLDFGAGMNCTPASHVLAVLDVGFQYEKKKNEFTDDNATTEISQTDVVLPYWKIGFEADVFRWMDIRMGATSDWLSRKVENGTKLSMAANQTYLGFGFNWGRLYVDTWADPELFLDGFNFISGRSNDMNWQISALYEMF